MHAALLAETESQKGILIGRNGSMVKSIGTAARREIERELGRRIHLDLAVKVRRGWRGDEAILDRLGIEPSASASRAAAPTPRQMLAFTPANPVQLDICSRGDARRR